MKKPQLIAQGAEAKIFLKDNVIIKERFEKKYRLKEIDDKLRKFRTKREAKVIQKLKDLRFPGPDLYEVDTKQMKIKMQKLPGKMVKDLFDKEENYKQFSKEIGKLIAMLHSNDIVHGDLTTSNMIVKSDTNQVHLIDFGLSFFSTQVEDKAVDLHLLRQALESKHYKVFDKAFEIVLESYKDNYENGVFVLDRLKKVEIRGRNKGKH